MTTQLKTIRALMVTDNEESLSLVRDLLRQSSIAHYELDPTTSYEEGLAFLRRGEHDVCLMEARLGGDANAFAVLQAMARFGGRAPIIVLTGPGDLDTGLAALEAGAMDTLDLGELTAGHLERAIRYVTERRKTEAALRGSQERLIEADLRKDELLAMLAHELRNPLAPIRYALQALRLDAPEDARLQRHRDLIDRQVRQMARLLDDLLDVTRMTRGRIHLQKGKVDLGDVVDQAVEAARPMIQEHRQELVYNRPSESLWIEGDAGRLEQAIRNLLHNAVKFSKAGGRIWLSVEHEGGEGSQGQAPMATIRIMDTGIGIDQDLLPRVFDLFSQTDQSLNRAQGGLGIGLTMVKYLVQMHGGAVRAHSGGLGQGSEFEIHLPLLAHPELKAANPRPARREAGTGDDNQALLGRSPRVLVVEDNLDSANSLAELIERWGYESRVVNDGPAALETASAFHPDVVLLDIGLPGMNGYQVARLMRARPALKDAMLVALTGYGQDEDRRCAEQAGFDRHFTKPVELEALQFLLKRAA